MNCWWEADSSSSCKMLRKSFLALLGGRGRSNDLSERLLDTTNDPSICPSVRSSVASVRPRSVDVFLVRPRRHKVASDLARGEGGLSSSLPLASFLSSRHSACLPNAQSLSQPFSQSDRLVDGLIMDGWRVATGPWPMAARARRMTAWPVGTWEVCAPSPVSRCCSSRAACDRNVASRK